MSVMIPKFNIVDTEYNTVVQIKIVMALHCIVITYNYFMLHNNIYYKPMTIKDGMNLHDLNN